MTAGVYENAFARFDSSVISAINAFKIPIFPQKAPVRRRDRTRVANVWLKPNAIGPRIKATNPMIITGRRPMLQNTGISLAVNRL